MVEKKEDVFNLYEDDIKAERRERQEDATLLVKFRNVFHDHADGPEIFAWLLEKCMVYETTFTGNTTTYFNEGKRSIGLDLVFTLEQAIDTPIMEFLRKEFKDGKGKRK